MMKQPDCSCRPQSDRPMGDGGGFTCKPARPEERRPPCCCAHPSDCRCPLCQMRPKPPCPPQECPCTDCPKECPCHSGRKAFPPNGFLLPKIIASGRQWQRCCRLQLNVDGLPDCAQPPLTLLCVTACGQPSWEQLPCDNRRQQRLQVNIPVACQVRDSCGCTFTGRSCVQTEVCLNLTVPASECWRHCLMILPCVRLICVPCTSQTPCFDAQLEVLVEAYMTRWEPCMVGMPKPVCPDLPLYPQPCIE